MKKLEFDHASRAIEKKVEALFNRTSTLLALVVFDIIGAIALHWWMNRF